MALNWRTYDALPYLKDYAAAAAHEANVKPIRGDDEGRKPLGRRDQKWRRIARDTDDSIIIFDDWSNKTPFIRFTLNGELHLYDTTWGDQKATYNEVMQRVTGLGFFTEAARMWVRYDGGTMPVAQAGKQRWDGEQWVKDGEDPAPTIMVKNERGYWVPKQAKGLVTHQVDRKGAKAVRQRYATALSYIKALTSLRRDDPPKHEEIVAAFRDTRLKDTSEENLKYYWRIHGELPEISSHRYAFKHEHAADLCALMASEDPGEQYKAYLWLGRGCGQSHVLKNADKVLMMHHHDEWFKAVEHEPGVKAIDKYGWAFP